MKVTHNAVKGRRIIMEIVAVFAAVLLPSIVMYFWIRKRDEARPGYGETCKKALLGGMTVVVPVITLDVVLVLIGNFAKLKDLGPIIYDFYRTFIMFAFAEELWKYVCFKGILKKSECNYSWYDVTAFMTVVGIGFEIAESIVSAFTSSPIQAIVRGLTLMHGTFGFIMGYYYGKAVRTGKKGYHVLSFLVPYLYHAVYDFTLSSSLNKIDWIAIIPVSLAFFSLVLLIIMIRFFIKAKADEKYMAPLNGSEAEEVPES